jgi:SAM-dependent methyltransferase
MRESTLGARRVEAAQAPSLTDQVPGVYAFCREHLFRDDTERIVASLWPADGPPLRARLLEVACGPGFYARRLAARFPELTVIGLDRSIAQVALAEARLAVSPLPNCRFETGDATALPYASDSIDGVVIARLLANVDDPARVIAEVHRVLQPGGRCFVAEPRSRLRAAIPVVLMRLVASLGGSQSGLAGGQDARRREGQQVSVLDAAAFDALVGGQPWARATTWVDGPYQYAVLEKDDRP